MNSRNHPIHPNGNSSQQIECGQFLHTVARALNYRTTLINYSVIGTGLTVTYEVLGWVSKLEPGIAWPVAGACLVGTTSASLIVQKIRAFGGPLIRLILRCFAKRRMAAGDTYDYTIGVNIGGGAIAFIFADEWNKELSRMRPGSSHLLAEKIDCTTLVERDGTIHTHPNLDQVRAFHKRVKSRAGCLNSGEKFRLLVICDESRSGDTINRLIKQLELPVLEIEALSFIRRDGCSGRINWHCLESNSRHILPFEETLKTFDR